MKLWDKGVEVNRRIEDFTVGKDRELDAFLAHYDVLGSKAHAQMLFETGILSKQENEDLQKNLDSFDELTQKSDFLIEPEFEDIHSKIEFYLTEKCGDAGKKIHTARSRNDQVLTALQLFLKDYLVSTKEKMIALVTIFLEKAEKHKEDLLPGYTHFQTGMPSSFGLWFSGYAENLIMDLDYLAVAYRMADQNPLGSGAGFGSSFPIDRERTQEILNFDELLVASTSAQILRGRLERSMALVLNMTCSTLSKMCYDLVWYNGQDLAFVELPPEMTTGSSIMPHKKNPDVFELCRAQCNGLQSVINSITLVSNNLPSGYHRDFQFLKEYLMEPLFKFQDILDILLFAIPEVQVRPNIEKQEKYKTMYTVENINRMVQEGIPFRDAYKKVAKQVQEGSFEPSIDFETSHIGSINSLGISRIRVKLQKAIERMSF